jgi:Ca2+-binding EF-hand superfamily protein
MNRPRIALIATTFAMLAPLAQAQMPVAGEPPATPLAAPSAPDTMQAPAPKAPKAAKDKTQRGMSDRFQHLDTDGDGMISRAEAAGAPQLAQKFDEVDADKDGRVQSSELKDYAKTQRRDKGAAGGKSKLDTNQDGVITREDVAGRPKALAKFDAADTDKDGRLSPEEAKAAKGK